MPGVKLIRLVKLVKLVTLSISNQTKIDQHRPQNRPKIDQKSSLDGAWVPFGPQGGSGSRLDPETLIRWTPWAPSSWEPKLFKNRQKIDPKLNMFFDHFFDRFWNPLGADLVGFWVPKWSQNWSRIGPKSDHEANANIFKIIGRACVFEDPRCLESIKNRS